MLDFLEVLENINKCIKSPPCIVWHMECYHYKTVRTTDSKGRTKTKRVKVVTWRGSKTFEIKHWEDQSASIASLFYLQSMELTRLETSKNISYTGESSARYTQEKSSFIAANKHRDRYWSISTLEDIPY